MLHLDHAYQKSIAFIGNAEDLDIIMPMYNLLESRDNYSMTSGSLWNYYRDEINNDANENANDKRVNINKIITSKSFEYKTKVIWSMPNDNNTLATEVVVPSLDLQLINCKIELDLSWSQECIICEI